ncbi:GIY-YIG nuclease family protein [Shimia thalassica]|uniref:GIY-YIG nuclease family protein n=1 Tax=Shimia thalassica TaxID=1715693 RepID=UPI0026E38582|nr:GIY-YIG nuclease family protein [Shimia thalassica]MDO6485217.1 GIY-YIG nuclease family protein [Shimia thalassica]
MTAGCGELEFDLPSALLTAILAKFDDIEPADLTIANTNEVPEAQGIYALYLKNPQRLVYIGKTDSDAGLKHRLSRHARKLIGRLNLRPDDVEFRAIRVFVFTAMDIETALIKHYGGVSSVAWNNSGFGSNDPGKERDTTNYKDDHWDTQYPIDLDTDYCDFAPGIYSVGEIMSELKLRLPFLLRFQRPGRSRSSYHEDFVNTQVHIQRRELTSRQILQECMDALPAGWHATALPSHIICYKNDNRNFPSGETIAVS